MQFAMSFGMAKKGPRQQRCQVLLLEQNPGLAHALELMLRQAGYRVKACTKEVEMTSSLTPGRLRAEEIDLVLADLADAGPDREIILNRLRAAATLLPVIAIAPYGQEQNRARLLNLPGCYLLTSPLDPEDLRQCLAKVTAKEKTRLEITRP